MTVTSRRENAPIQGFLYCLSWIELEFWICERLMIYEQLETTEVCKTVISCDSTNSKNSVTEQQHLPHVIQIIVTFLSSSVWCKTRESSCRCRCEPRCCTSTRFDLLCIHVRLITLTKVYKRLESSSEICTATVGWKTSAHNGRSNVCCSFIHFCARFSSGEGRVGAALRRLEMPYGQQQSHIVLLTPRQDGPRKVRDLVTLRTPLVTPLVGRHLGRFPMSVISRIASPTIPGTHGRSNVAGVSRFGEVSRHSWLYKFHSWALCCKVSHRELLAKIPPAACTCDSTLSVISQE